MSLLSRRLAQKEAEFERMVTRLAERKAKADAVERRRREHRRFLLGAALEKMMSSDGDLCRRVEEFMRSSLKRRYELEAFDLTQPHSYFARLVAPKEARSE